MDPRRQARKLNRMLAYMLGRRPSEFGLVPLTDGRVKLRELLKALHEEDGWRRIRPADIEALRPLLGRPAVELNAGWIRAADRSALSAPTPIAHPPALLYSAIRRRAWPVVRESGLRPGGLPWVVMSRERDMALRIGRRSDPDPVVLEVATRGLEQAGIQLLDAGHPLLCGPFLPPACLHGPPPAREKRKAGPAEPPPPPHPVPEPGSFRLRVPGPGRTGRRERRKPSWRRERRRKPHAGDPWDP